MRINTYLHVPVFQLQPDNLGSELTKRQHSLFQTAFLLPQNLHSFVVLL